MNDIYRINISLRIETILEPEAEAAYPRCLAGEGARSA